MMWCSSSESQKYYAAEVHYLVSYVIMSDANNTSNIDFIDSVTQNVSIDDLKPGTSYNVCVQTGVDYHRGPKSCLSLNTQESTGELDLHAHHRPSDFEEYYNHSLIYESVV